MRARARGCQLFPPKGEQGKQGEAGQQCTREANTPQKVLVTACTANHQKTIVLQAISDASGPSPHSGNEHDLPDVLAFLDEAVGIGRLLERERLRNHRPDHTLIR